MCRRHREQARSHMGSAVNMSFMFASAVGLAFSVGWRDVFVSKPTPAPDELHPLPLMHISAGRRFTGRVGLVAQHGRGFFQFARALGLPGLPMQPPGVGVLG